MSDDDRTVDADEATMDELRRLAAEARADTPAGDDDPADTTVDADEATMDELRLAAEARADAPAGDDDPADTTVDADEATLDELRRLAAEARERAHDHEPTSVGNGASPAPPSAFDPDAFDPPTFETPPFEPPAPDSAPEPAPQARTPAGAPMAPGVADRVWRPPPRMVMPTEPEKQHHVHHGPWRTIAIVLAGLVVALVAFLLVWFLVIDDEPTDQPEIDPLTSLPIDADVDDGTDDVSEEGG